MKGTKLWKLKWSVRYQCLIQDNATQMYTVFEICRRGAAISLFLELYAFCRVWDRKSNEAILFFDADPFVYPRAHQTIYGTAIWIGARWNFFVIV